MRALHFVTGGSRLKLPTSPPSRCYIPTIFPLSYSRKFMVKMSIHSTPSGSAIPIDTIVLGCGMVALDYLVTVDSYPKPDDKIRSTSFQVQGGGNTGNAMTCAARLGLTPRIISKVADDSQGKRILNELEDDDIDTSFIVVASHRKTRTSIYTPGYPPMVADDLPYSSLSSALDGARLVYTDGVLHEAALVVAQEGQLPKDSLVAHLPDMRALHTFPPSRCHIPTNFTLSYSRKFMVKMSIHSTPSASSKSIDTIVVCTHLVLFISC
ncbi:hypothetical protein MTR67_036946 [Solanum verrucosum]|uniref:Carbohydrate kinase PfkB domain-containing protein n=1 Tax=Solanum verrucosum TaxID=315347 RepID=A0AAF0ZLG3_SOLVR|nr:hypothetical protein MTR67_036946 [Solanum verrucosum]